MAKAFRVAEMRMSKPDGQRKGAIRSIGVSTVIVALPLLFIFAAIEIRVLLTTSPQFVLIEPTAGQTGCLPPPSLAMIGFKLWNSGNADGYATVALLVDGANSWSKPYVVKAGDTLGVEQTVVLDGCGSHSLELTIVSTGRLLFLISPAYGTCNLSSWP